MRSQSSSMMTDLNNRIFALNKPVGPTSNRLLNALRKKLNTRRIGHAGTLDPLAEGVLVVAVGSATKQLHAIVGQEKEYRATITLGRTSETDDAEGPIISRSGSTPPTAQHVQSALSNFIGKIQQIPPAYSAIKIKGREAYKRVRSGEQVKLPSREVEIKRIDLLDYRWPILRLAVVCGKGVYIRSLARDLGAALKVGGYLSGLVRTRVGPFILEEALSPDDLGISWF